MERKHGLYDHIYKNKKIQIIFKGIVVLLAVVLAVTFALSVTYSKIREEDFYKSPWNNGADSDYELNFLVVMYQTSQDFLAKFQESIYNITEENRILLDFVYAEDIDQAINSINIAVAAKIDGIIVQGVYDVEYIAAINKAIDKGIPVEFIYTDARGTNRNYFVGFNAYDFGKKAARVTIDAVQWRKGDVALLVQSFSENEKDITSSLIIEGFKSIMDKYVGMKIVEINRTSHDLLSAEDITYEILSGHPDVDVIICTSEKDTLGAAQVIIDLNKVGDIKLIGVGVSEEIMKYLELEIISATFDMKPEMMSQKCIETMLGIGATSDFIEIPFDVVTKEDADRYQ